MDWLRNLFSGAGSLSAQDWGRGLGAIGQIYGTRLLGQGYDRQFAAQRKRFEDERRMREDYNRRLDLERAEKNRLYDESIAQQDSLAGERRAQLAASLASYENDFKDDLEARFKGLMAGRTQAPSTAVSQALEGKAPQVVQENLERERAKRRPGTDRKARGMARMTANYGALAGQARKDLASQDLLKNLAFIARDAESTANRRQMMFPTQQRYESIYTGTDPKADMYKAVGGGLVNWGMSKNSGSMGQLASALFGNGNPYRNNPYFNFKPQ